jgi:hypothetical protein
MLCNHIASSELENQHAKDWDTADHTACNWVKVKKVKIEACKLIHNSSQTPAASKETFTQSWPAGFTDNKEKSKTDSPVCYNCSKAGYLKHDCSEPQQSDINYIKIELHELKKDYKRDWR